jgi:8-oxo-dGTP pyrophosphatase MutT (NUDIX family)
MTPSSAPVSILPGPIPAATLILMRDRHGAAPDILMVERSRALAFAGGALVFPGGRIDPGDGEMASMIGGDRWSDGGDAAARVAAIRETLEEAGIAIGMPISAEATETVRRVLNGGAAIGPALAGMGVRLDLGALTPFARWCPAHPLPRRFDTRFFVAAAGDAIGSVDHTENVRLAWASAADHLDAAARGEAELIFPTRRVLERLATFPSLAAAIADAALRPRRTVVPWEEVRGGVPYLCIADDLGYPVTAEPLTRTRRG